MIRIKKIHCQRCDLDISDLYRYGHRAQPLCLPCYQALYQCRDCGYLGKDPHHCLRPSWR